MGNIGAGFDNDGDLVPDRNAWMQPVGDPALYDASCVRLAKTYGCVIVKLNDGTEQLIPFEDQLYFEHVPANNTGAVGLVFYEFLPLQAGCTAALSPYQEVASGFDNEKFNGDFGAGVPPLSTGSSAVTLDKTAPQTVAAGGSMTYALTATNTQSQPLAYPTMGLPFVLEDGLPAGTTRRRFGE